MKPTKNHKFCVDCMRAKMLFPSEKKALRCIEMNGDEIYEKSGRRPIRAYYCIACGGWHITSREFRPNFHSPVELYFLKKDEINRTLNKLSNVLPGNNFDKALKTKVGILSQLVMRKKILKSQCEEMIHQLIGIFEDLVKARLVTKAITKSFNRFCAICNIFQEKVAKGRLQPEPQVLKLKSHKQV